MRNWLTCCCFCLIIHLFFFSYPPLCLVLHFSLFGFISKLSIQMARAMKSVLFSFHFISVLLSSKLFSFFAVTFLTVTLVGGMVAWSEKCSLFSHDLNYLYLLGNFSLDSPSQSNLIICFSAVAALCQ